MCKYEFWTALLVQNFTETQTSLAQNWCQLSCQEETVIKRYHLQSLCIFLCKYFSFLYICHFYNVIFHKAGIVIE